MHRAVVGIGSNIQPRRHTDLARREIARRFALVAESDWEWTEPVGAAGQDVYLNGAVLVETDLDHAAFRLALRSIEADLGRVRTPEAFAPRTIDLDVVVFDGVLVDADALTRGYLRRSVEQLLGVSVESLPRGQML